MNRVDDLRFQSPRLGVALETAWAEQQTPMESRGSGMRKGWTIGHFRDVPVVVHISMLVVIPLFTVGMTYENFPGLLTKIGVAPNALSLPPVLFGFALSIGLFGSVLLHEMGHALVALMTGGRVRRITLMALGGMTEIDQDDATPGQTVAVAFAGPLANILIGAACLLFARLLPTVWIDGHVFLLMLGGINMILALFNLLPAFPLDGGRILKGCLSWRFAERQAAIIAGTVGRTFALLVGFWGFSRGDLFLIIVATFLYFGSSSDARAVDNREALTGLTARQAMSTRVVNVGPDRPVTSVARHMLMQDATAALVSKRTETLGVVLPRDLQHADVDEVGDLIEVEALYADIDAPLSEVVREMRWSRRPAIVRDQYNAIVGVVTLAEVERAITLRKIADRGLISPDASTESQEHGA